MVRELPAVGGLRQFQLLTDDGRRVLGYVSEGHIPSGTALFCWGHGLGHPEHGVHAFSCPEVHEVRGWLALARGAGSS